MTTLGATHPLPLPTLLASAQKVQGFWAALPLAKRLQVVESLRGHIADQAPALAAAAAKSRGRSVAEKLTSEVLPLADACRWLVRNAPRLLAPRRNGRKGRPLWMQGVSFEVERQPFGVITIIGPGNYPLFLSAVQTLHAIVAGNAVFLKPAPQTGEVAALFERLLLESGCPAGLLTLLPETVKETQALLSLGVDKVIFTGSSQNGRDILERLAITRTPSVMELSGEDPIVVLSDADIDLVGKALRFGERLNGGETCIAPRRLIVVESIAEPLLAHLAAEKIAPSFPIETAPSDDSVHLRVNFAKYALGATLFSRDIPKAQRIASRFKTGFVLINDMILPTADPRFPFGGIKESGFGSTRGDEGLLEMTFPHVVALSQSRQRFHFDEPDPGDAHLFTAYIRAAHGKKRLRAILELIRALLQKVKTKPL